MRHVRITLFAACVAALYAVSRADVHPLLAVLLSALFSVLGWAAVRR